MESHRFLVVVCSVLTLWGFSAGAALASGSQPDVPGFGVSASGGVIVLNENDTALPDGFVNIPIAVGAEYHISRIFAAEAEFSCLLPVEQEIELDVVNTVDRKTPSIFTYQANLIAKLPSEASAWSPYVTAGCGALTVLSNTDDDRLPQLEEAQTMFAMNFGAGVSYAFTPNWEVRADFREFAAFPADDAEGFSADGTADPIWMERVTVGLAYRF